MPCLGNLPAIDFPLYKQLTPYSSLSVLLAFEIILLYYPKIVDYVNKVSHFFYILYEKENLVPK